MSEKNKKKLPSTLGRPKVREEKHVDWNVTIHPHLKNAIQQVAKLKNQTQLEFLQTFLKASLLHHVQYTESETTYNYIKDLISDVPDL